MKIEARVTSMHGRHDVALATEGREHVIAVAPRPGGGSAANGGELLCLAIAGCRALFPAFVTPGFGHVLVEGDDEQAEADHDRDRVVETEVHGFPYARLAVACACACGWLASFMMNFGLKTKMRIGNSVCEPT